MNKKAVSDAVLHVKYLWEIGFNLEELIRIYNLGEKEKEEVLELCKKKK